MRQRSEHAARRRSFDSAVSGQRGDAQSPRAFHGPRCTLVWTLSDQDRARLGKDLAIFDEGTTSLLNFRSVAEA